MGIIVTGVVVVGAIAFGTGYYFLNLQPAEPAWEVYSTDGARVGDPGHNLVGKNWSGEPGSVSTDGEETSS
ncbi:hypothetical protein FB009_12721 [Sinorhizobium medicae]|nr:hypothetical protein BMJ35_16875 [Sinorhizobium medicae]RVI56512.1 hypothetical protein CN192_13390 [Sinorhizobium medicae]RVJ36659.1 hypothetical protein CN180_27270 [Sinorhizobium medicae]RVJ61462.1 hypothetical protein CN178_12990 [Sinorhizobium medicae]TWA32235.1 hypothetical protein FB009_12721 [Sinorhizobium medicae]